MIRTLAPYKNRTIISVSISFLFRSIFFRFHVDFHEEKKTKKETIARCYHYMNQEHQTLRTENQEELKREKKMILFTMKNNRL